MHKRKFFLNFANYSASQKILVLDRDLYTDPLVGADTFGQFATGHMVDLRILLIDYKKWPECEYMAPTGEWLPVSTLTRI